MRLQIVEFLKSGEKNVGVIVKALGIPQSSLSRHLLVLKDRSGFKQLRQEKEGLRKEGIFNARLA